MRSERRGRTAALLLALAVLAGPARAQEEEARHATVERGRALARVADIVLLPDGTATPGERTLWLLVDPTPSVAALGLPAAMRAAVARHAGALGDTRIVVASVERPDEPVAPPSAEPAAVAAAIERVLDGPSDRIRDVYEAVREAAGALRRRKGQRDLLLVTLDNGDAESDLEDAVRDLDRADVRCFVLAREAYLADSWWLERQGQAPRGTTLRGADGAFVELPWSILFQPSRGLVPVASGFPMYGLARLTAATGGRVFLHVPETASQHQCVAWGLCPFCDGDHAPLDRAYRTHRLRAIAPVVSGRDDAYEAAAGDPFFRALLEAWEHAAREGIVGTHPPVERRGASLKEDRPRTGRRGLDTTSTSWRSLATRAERLATDCAGVLRRYEAALAHAHEAGGLERYEGLAESFRVLLHLTRLNCLYLVAYCQEAGPVLVDRDPAEVEPPEAPYHLEGQRHVGIGYTTMGLCHGVAPFLRLHLPGGEPLREELRAFDGLVEAHLDRWRHTPFAEVVHRAGIARFHPTFRGRPTDPPDRRPTGSTSESPTTPNTRPPRGGAPSGGGGSSGPVTGGG